jgi:uncharacterized protein (DUF1330 family)
LTNDSPHYLVVVCHLPEFTPAVLEYSRRVAELVPRFGGEYLMRGCPAAVLEGEWSARARLVVSRWPTRTALEEFWHSTEYQQSVKPLRAGTGIYDVVVFPDADQALSPVPTAPSG